MHRIDTSGNIAGLFTEGDQGLGIPATKVGDAWLNDVQEEVCNVIEAAGITLSKGTRTQLLSALTNAGLTMNGIKFPAVQVPSVGANVLDDYEEGTWTPVLGGSGGTSGQAYDYQLGHYIKVGRIVVALCDFRLSNKGTITGGVEIQGLPFAAHGGGSFSDAAGTVGYFGGLATAMTALTTSLPDGGSIAQVFGLTAAATSVSQLSASNIGNSAEFRIAYTYLAAA